MIIFCHNVLKVENVGSEKISRWNYRGSIKVVTSQCWVLSTLTCDWKWWGLAAPHTFQLGCENRLAQQQQHDESVGWRATTPVSSTDVRAPHISWNTSAVCYLWSQALLPGRWVVCISKGMTVTEEMRSNKHCEVKYRRVSCFLVLQLSSWKGSQYCGLNEQLSIKNTWM